MKTISLSDQQIKNALLFLDRVECKGIHEATALVELAMAIGKAKDIEELKPNAKK
jgi:hypothetical protein